MTYLRRADARGRANLGWLDSRHSFSFGDYYDPDHMGFSALRVINDDRVAPGAGFDTHGHRDMEIISYVLAGEIEHRDSLGNRFVIAAGEVQRMSAGSGIRHSEFNASSERELSFLQIWIPPNQLGISPSYEQRRIEQQGPLTALVTPGGASGTLGIHQDVSLYRLQLTAGETHSLRLQSRSGYLHLVRGKLRLEIDAGQADTSVIPPFLTAAKSREL